MSELAKELARLLQEPIGRPDDAERAGKAAEALAELLRAEEKAESILAERQNRARIGGSTTLAGKSLQDAAEAVLKTAGTPLHAKELGSRIKARGWTHPRGKPARPDQIVHQLAARLPRDPQRFERIGPNTFGLVAWREGTAVSPQRPRVGLFSGPGGSIGRKTGESPDAAAGSSEWR